MKKLLSVVFAAVMAALITSLLFIGAVAQSDFSFTVSDTSGGAVKTVYYLNPNVPQTVYVGLKGTDTAPDIPDAIVLIQFSRTDLSLTVNGSADQLVDYGYWGPLNTGFAIGADYNGETPFDVTLDTKNPYTVTFSLVSLAEAAPLLGIDPANLEGWELTQTQVNAAVTGLTAAGKIYASGTVQINAPFTVTEKYQDENGTAISDDTSGDVLYGDSYSKDAPDIAGYVYKGYKVDNGTLTAGDPAVIADVTASHTVVFVYGPAPAATTTAEQTTATSTVETTVTTVPPVTTAATSHSAAPSPSPQTGYTPNYTGGLIALSVAGVIVFFALRKRDKKEE